jgi:methyl-accepting chemotaxis protein
MSWKDLRIGAKLAIGFGTLLLLIVIGGLVGYRGLKTVDHSMVVVTDEQAPLIDTSMEMKIALMDAMAAMDEYMADTSVLATDDESQLERLTAAYQEATDRFDRGIKAILNGGDLNGIKVIATGNSELADRVKKAAELHDARYHATARELMTDGKALLKRKGERDQAMAAMEELFNEIQADSATLEETVAREIHQHARSGDIGAAAQAILRDEVPLADMSMEMKFAIANTRIALEELVQSRSLDALAQSEQKYKAWLAVFDEMANAMLNGGSIDGESITATDNPKIRAQVEELNRNHADFEARSAGMITAQKNLLTQSAEVEETMARLDAAGEETKDLLAQVEDLAGADMAKATATGRASSSQAIHWQIVVVLCSLVIGGLLGFIITRAIAGPVRKGVELADEIAKGDFSQRLNLERRDEIGILAQALDRMAANLQKKADVAESIADGKLDVNIELASEKDQLGLSLQRMTDSLNEILGQVQTAAEQIATGGGQVADAAQSLSQGATESAASLEEISASLNQLSSQTATNADNANQANSLTAEAGNAAQLGSRQMAAMVSAMTEINQSSQSISRIIKTIDEIAFQTNLLALNAAVEAARAGQHGKGFAVVAEEVRNLAARSAKAAQETSELIEGSVEKTANGSRIAQQTAEALGHIVSGIDKVTNLVAEIAAASSEQAQGVGQINLGVGQIDQVTQQNTAHAEESAAAAEELSGQAEELRQMLQRFTLREAAQWSGRPISVLPAGSDGKESPPWPSA